MWKIGEVKRLGKETVKKNYWISFVVVFVLIIFATGSAFGGLTLTWKASDLDFIHWLWHNPCLFFVVLGALLLLILLMAVVVILYSIYFMCPVRVGIAKFAVEADRGNADAGNIMFAFKKGQFKSIVKTVFVKELFIFFWSLLLIIPGIIKIYQWRLVEYLVADNPKLSSKEARVLSKKYMKGNKWKTFMFDLSFIGWYILSVITAGIVGIFWVEPYKMHANAALYLAVLPKVSTVEVKKVSSKKSTAKKPAAKKTVSKKNSEKSAE